MGDVYQEKDEAVLGCRWGGLIAFEGEMSVLGGKSVAVPSRVGVLIMKAFVLCKYSQVTA